MKPVDATVAVLYVDPDAEERLTRTGLDVACEPDLDRGLDRCVAGRFDCVVVGTGTERSTDTQTGQETETGTEATGDPEGSESRLAALASVRALTDRPVVAVTGPSGAGATALLEAGADDVAAPPTTPDAAAALAARVRNLATLHDGRRGRLPARTETGDRALRAVAASLAEVSADTDLGFEARGERLLDVGCDLLGVEWGALVHVRDGVRQAVVVHGDGPEPGAESAPSADDHLGPAEADGGRARVAARETDTHVDARAGDATLAGEVFVEGAPYGTVQFTATGPRERAFTEVDRAVVDLLAQWFSHELTRRAVEARLRRRNDRLDRFASVVSHDLRNPLNVVAGRVSLAGTVAGDPAVRSHLAEAETGLDRMEDLIASLLDLARHGERVRDSRPVSVGGVAREAWATVESGGARLVVTGDPGEVAGDPLRLRRLFENLFRNSVEHGSTGNRTRSDDPVEHGSTGPKHAPDARDTPRQSTCVEVGALESGGGFYVADDGPGLPADEDVFVPGFSTCEDGTGLGLFIVRQIVEAHGWSVRTTESESGGARFEFRAAREVAHEAV